jgi:predicted DNA-binding transcriptional regulator AlpA
MPRTATLPGRLLTARALAFALSISVRSAWRYARTGRLPAPVYPTPKSPRWNPAAVAAFLKRS